MLLASVQHSPAIRTCVEALNRAGGEQRRLWLAVNLPACKTGRWAVLLFWKGGRNVRAPILIP